MHLESLKVIKFSVKQLCNIRKAYLTSDIRSAAYETVYSTLALYHDMREPQYG